MCDTYHRNRMLFAVCLVHGQTVTIISLGCDESRSTRTRTLCACVLACQMKSHIYCSTDDRSTKHVLYERVMIHPMGRVVS
jgi:hypothetical protein